MTGGQDKFIEFPGAIHCRGLLEFNDRQGDVFRCARTVNSVKDEEAREFRSLKKAKARVALWCFCPPVGIKRSATYLDGWMDGWMECCHGWLSRKQNVERQNLGRFVAWPRKRKWEL